MGHNKYSGRCSDKFCISKRFAPRACFSLVLRNSISSSCVSKGMAKEADYNSAAPCRAAMQNEQKGR